MRTTPGDNLVDHAVDRVGDNLACGQRKLWTTSMDTPVVHCPACHDAPGAQMTGNGSLTATICAPEPYQGCGGMGQRKTSGRSTTARIATAPASTRFPSLFGSIASSVRDVAVGVPMVAGRPCCQVDAVGVV